MLKERILELFQKHQWKIVGSFIGFLVAVFILIIGFFRTIFIFLLMSIGFYLGKRVDNRESISELLDRILPPGNFK